MNDPIGLTDPLGLNVSADEGYDCTCTRFHYSNPATGEGYWGAWSCSCTPAGGGGGGEGTDPQSNQKEPCPPDFKALLQVGELLVAAGLDKAIGNDDNIKLSQSGKGFLLSFDNQQEAQKVLGNEKLFAGGGSYGSQEHQQELTNAFGKVQGGNFADFRSFNGGNTTLGDRSLQVVLYRDKNKNILGAYVDSDRFNFRQDAVGFFGHTFIEYLPFKFLGLFGVKRKCA